MPAILEEHRSADQTFTFDCFQCGRFTIGHDAENRLKKTPLTPAQAAAVCGYIHRNSGLTITADDLAELRDMRAPSVSQKAASVLLALGRRYPLPGTQIPDPSTVVAELFIRLSFFHDRGPQYPEDVGKDTNFRQVEWLAIASTADPNELEWLITDVLKRQGFIREGDPFIFEGRTGKNLVITGAGWAEIDRLTRVNEGSRIGFVAMRFSDEFSEFYNAVGRGIRNAGFEPLRIDRKQHNNRIDDEIIATIKTSRFVVADFTEHRGGIYFEAGYALGLGLPLIWIVRQDKLNDVHFDNRQYNFIVWNNAELDALTSALNNRIVATIGKGPVSSRASV